MANPIDNNFSKILEFTVLAITVGCSIWVAFLAAGLDVALAMR